MFNSINGLKKNNLFLCSLNLIRFLFLHYDSICGYDEAKRSCVSEGLIMGNIILSILLTFLAKIQSPKVRFPNCTRTSPIVADNSNDCSAEKLAISNNFLFSSTILVAAMYLSLWFGWSPVNIANMRSLKININYQLSASEALNWAASMFLSDFSNKIKTKTLKF